MAYQGDTTRTELSTKELLKKILIELMKINKYNEEAMEYEVTEKDIEFEEEL